ncbi:hypothetical protein NDU88_007617 [Pleurodeles waltl]|uniref:Uncharacterized protein n=1 Tax=Pleurodeles waltl TaxID=8319 RepID=A0AAV7VTD7_PLEWA|nr:hypothetical protein NDU88_007617 [Pleurodeles waltl]
MACTSPPEASDPPHTESLGPSSTLDSRSRIPSPTARQAETPTRVSANAPPPDCVEGLGPRPLRALVLNRSQLRLQSTPGVHTGSLDCPACSES